MTSTPLRDPLQLAYQWYSLDVLSEGRMIFNASQGASGVQGGAFEAEFAAFHIDPVSRMRRMEEAIEILRLASIGEAVSYEGEYQQVVEVVRGLTEVRECHHVAGGTCYILKAVVSSIAHVETLVEHLTLYGDLTTSIVLSSPIIRKTLEPRRKTAMPE